MSKRLIYAEDALANIDRDRAYMSDVGRIHARAAVNDATAVDAVEVVHGRWAELPMPRTMWKYRCDKCGCPQDYKHNYCPNCGAKMDGDGNG